MPTVHIPAITGQTFNMLSSCASTALPSSKNSTGQPISEMFAWTTGIKATSTEWKKEVTRTSQNSLESTACKRLIFAIKSQAEPALTTENSLTERILDHNLM